MRQSPHGLSKLALSFLLFLPHRGPTTFPDGPALQAQAAWISTPPPWVCLSPLPAPTCKFLLPQGTSSVKPSFTKSTPPLPQPSPSCPQAELLTWLCCLMFWFWDLSHPARCRLGAESQKLLSSSWGSLSSLVGRSLRPGALSLYKQARTSFWGFLQQSLPEPWRRIS